MTARSSRASSATRAPTAAAAGPDPFAAHGPRHVDGEDHAAAGTDPFSDDDVAVVGERALDQVGQGGVEVDVVGTAVVAQRGQLPDPPPGGDVTSGPGHGQAGRDLVGAAQHLAVSVAVGGGGVEELCRLVGDPGAAAARAVRAPPVAATAGPGHEGHHRRAS